MDIREACDAAFVVASLLKVWKRERAGDSRYLVMVCEF